MFEWKARLILDGAKLIGIHKARYYKRKDGLALGPGKILKKKNYFKKSTPFLNYVSILGAFVSALEYSSGAKADIVGKPESAFFLSSIREFNVQPDECLMIGDVIKSVTLVWI